MNRNLKSNIGQLLVLATLVIGMNACNKKVIVDIGYPADKPTMAAKVNMWLNKQAADAHKQEQKTQIELLTNNLAINKLWVEVLQETEKMILVPINDGFAISVNKAKPVTNYLMVILDVDGNVRKGQLLQYTEPGKNVKVPLPINAMHRFYNSEHPNGQFTAILINSMNRLLWEVENKNNELIRFSKTEPRKGAGGGLDNSSTNSLSCTSWYLVTTTYYSDGTSSSTSELLFVTCEQTDISNDDGSGGGGTGDSGQAANLEPLTGQKTWYPKQDYYGIWKVVSTEGFTGYRDTVWHMPKFTATSHKGDAFSAPPNTGTWTNTGVTNSLTSDDMAKVYISGTINLINQDPIILLDKQNRFLAIEIWP